MTPRYAFRRGIGGIAGLAWACALLLPLASPAAAVEAPERRDGRNGLSPRLAELSQPSVRALPPVAEARTLSVASRGPGSLLRDDRGRVLVEVGFDGGATAAVEDLREAGGSPLSVSRRYQTVSVWASPGQLTRLADVPGVGAVTEVLRPVVAASSCPAGIAVSEGDLQLRAAEARGAFGVDGTGVTVGVLSDSFDEDALAPTHESQDVASGDLPGPANTCAGQSTPVNVLEDFSDPSASDEGRGMAQIVHDLAPGADLSFATAFVSLPGFAQNVEDLAAAGADVIVDDVSYFEEPFFQEGPVGVAVGNVTQSGVTYFSSAGNNNVVLAGRDVASWEAPQFRDAGSCPAAAPAYADHCMDFDPGAGVDPTFGLKVAGEETLILDLQWAQPWNGVTTDLDAYLLNAADAVVADSENFNVSTTKKPFEFLAWTNSTGSAQTVRVAVNRCDVVCGGADGGDGASPRLKFALLQNGGGILESEYPESVGTDVVGPTIFGHNGAADAVSTGAIRFNTTTQPEPFSSRGPVTHYFGPVSGVVPALPLASPRTLAKPDLVATDCGVTTFFVPTATPGLFRFCGTSAAAPHAAAVAALMRDVDKSLSPAQIRSILRSTALPVGAFGAVAVGAGRIDALAALGAVAPEEEQPDTSPPAGPTSTAQGRTIAAAPDVRRPETFLRRRPGRLVLTSGRRARLVFRFGADEAGVVFLCRVDRGRFRRCAARLARRFGLGPHVVRVKARDAAGNVDRTPAVARFAVRHRG
jgi:Subtilase family